MQIFNRYKNDSILIYNLKIQLFLFKGLIKNQILLPAHISISNSTNLHLYKIGYIRKYYSKSIIKQHINAPWYYLE